MKLLKRKIDRYLLDWKNNPKRKPLIVKGAVDWLKEAGVINVC